MTFAYVFLFSPGQLGADVKLGTRSDGVLVVRKTWRAWKAYEFECEVKSYLLLHAQGTHALNPLHCSCGISVRLCWLYRSSGGSTEALGLLAQRRHGRADDGAGVCVWRAAPPAV